MKTLYLIRHAKSSWKYPELDDFERPLNKRGHRDAPIMGEFLIKINAIPDIIFSSPALRACTTARILAEKINYPLDQIQYSESLYISGISGILDFIHNIDDSKTSAAIVSHNPSLTQCANYLGNEQVSNIPTCGIFCLNLNIKKWKQIKEYCGELEFFEFPKMHI